MRRRLPNNESKQMSLALGAQFVEALMDSPVAEAKELAKDRAAQKVFDSVQYVMEDLSLPNFLHSAMCAMSLPIKCPTDEMAPIIRQDGNYSLIIQPLERMEPVGPNGEFVPVKRGVPFGKHARLVLLYVMTEAVRTGKREVFLGATFSAWMRRMGLTSTTSGGSRGTRSLVQAQIDRLMHCEWTMRWDEKIAEEGTPPQSIADSDTSDGTAAEGSDAAVVADRGTPARKRRRGTKQPGSITAFAVNDMRMVNKFAGLRTSEGDFVTNFVLSEAFFENLVRHSVPLNDRAIVALQNSPTQLDLYTWLAYRLPRIPVGSQVCLSWADLAKHLGNDSSTVRKLRQTVRAAWQEVSGVYQQARHSVDFGDLVIRLRYADPPTKGHMIKEDPSRPGFSVVDTLKPTRSAKVQVGAADTAGKGDQALLPSPEASRLLFPTSGHLQFSCRELYDIGVRHGSGNDVSIMAAGFRKLIGDEIGTLEGEALKRRWLAYCSKWKPV